ncbi:MAG: cytochrome c3 family protein [Verrucomicrobiota bacterium]
MISPPHRNFTGKRFCALWLLVMTVCGGLLLAGCSTETKYKWLSTFFDGVPVPGATNAPPPVVPEEMAAANSSPNALPPKPAVKVVNTHTTHPPFADGQCTECHESKYSQGLKGTQNAVCFSCHDDFLAKARIKHQPVENGECSSCHDPHESEYKNLLRKKGNELCLICHDDPLAAGKVKHQAVESGDCLDCHSPHASNFKGLLKKSVKDTCFDCHDDVAKKKVVHQPVGDGDCLACHTPHASANKHLVTKTVPGLCWDCHDNFLEKAKFKHDVVEDCTSCHNPHQSDEAKLLAKSLPALCLDCHDAKDLKTDKGHAGAENKSCLECHDPHVGDNSNLLKPNAAGNLPAPPASAPAK